MHNNWLLQFRKKGVFVFSFCFCDDVAASPCCDDLMLHYHHCHYLQKVKMGICGLFYFIPSQFWLFWMLHQFYMKNIYFVVLINVASIISLWRLFSRPANSLKQGTLYQSRQALGTSDVHMTCLLVLEGNFWWINAV